ncbi:hypothetical protein GCM10010912_12850 [Paenibacillus albidus]|uniref:Uncharacterized protein n=1 Tax=Paenibacillus albidus TaxID=2041023 RepID=A0A917C2S3_9BACL|nr:hypothetical protein GCM10010912_12850 [Paenibacillus albidus]
MGQNTPGDGNLTRDMDIANPKRSKAVKRKCDGFASASILIPVHSLCCPLRELTNKSIINNDCF